MARIFTLLSPRLNDLQNYIDVDPYGWDNPTPDPWLGDHRPASEDMWAHYPAIENRNLGGNFQCTAVTVPYDSGTELELLDSQDPRLTPDLTAVTTYILDDSDDEFTAIGLWETDNCATDACYEDNWHHTTTSGITAVWHPVAGILYAQEYDLYAYIPQGATTTQASYKIIHNNTSHWAGIRQNSFFGRYCSRLGLYRAV
ncbi:MAG: hypothetical protein M5U34_00300 [Chloroflexi bacterium]|nr:hypothetical protein [Chloroflexota bacterium]